MKFRVGLLAGTATIVLLIGCGGGGESASSRPLTKKAFLAQGNEICTRGVKEKDRILNAGFEKLAQEGGEPAKKDVGKVVVQILPPLERTLEQLGELRPPDEDAQAVNTILGEWETELQKARANPAGAVSATFLETPNVKASEYGLTSCSL